MNEPLPNRWLIAPNKLNDEIFEDFYFLMLVMSGKHALYLTTGNIISAYLLNPLSRSIRR